MITPERVFSYKTYATDPNFAKRENTRLDLKKY